MTKALEKRKENQLSSPYERSEPEEGAWRSTRIEDHLSDVDSLTIKERGEMRALGTVAGKIYKNSVKFYKNHLLSLDADDPTREELTPEKIHEKSTYSTQIEYILQRSVDEVSWGDIQSLLEQDRDAAMSVWLAIKKIVREDLAAGSLASQAVLANQTPYQRATFGVVLESFERAWQPTNVIEQTMLEMLVQAYLSYNHWLRVAMNAAEYAYNVIEPDNAKDGRWNPPRLSADETIENAMAMADRFNRLYLRVLRQMRDLRRYTPALTINNPQQVNIAADGGQQVNMTQKKKKRRKKLP